MLKVLAAYEHTGLEPSEVDALKAENKKLSVKIEQDKKDFQNTLDNLSGNYTDETIKLEYKISEKDKRITELKKKLEEAWADPDLH